MKNDFVLIPISAFNAIYDAICRALTDYETTNDKQQFYFDVVELQNMFDRLEV